MSKEAVKLTNLGLPRFHRVSEVPPLKMVDRPPRPNALQTPYVDLSAAASGLTLRTGAGIRFANNPVLVADPSVPIGNHFSSGVLHVTRIDYLEMLLLHPGINQRLEARLRGVLPSGNLHGFRVKLWQSLNGQGKPRILPLGVSGVITFGNHPDSNSVVVSRQAGLSLNPRVWSFPVDGGVREDPKRDFQAEVDVELGWFHEVGLESLITHDHWSFLGVSEPRRSESLPMVAPTGINFVFRCDISEDAVHLANGGLIRAGGNEEIAHMEVVPASQWTERAVGRKVSEALLAALIDQGETKKVEIEKWIEQTERLEAAMADKELNREEPALAPDQQPAAPHRGIRATSETQYGSAYFRAITKRYPSLRAADDQLVDESTTLGPELMFEEIPSNDEDACRTALRVFEVLVPILVGLEAERGKGDRRGNQKRFEYVTFARLHEAVVYRVCHLVFGGDPRWAEYLGARLAPYGPKPPSQSIGKQLATAANGYLSKESDSLDADSKSYLKYFKEARRNERDASHLQLDTELFLFAVALTAKRDRGDADAAEYSLSPTHQRSLSNNPLAFAYKAAGIIATRTASTSQLRLGYEFSCNSCARFPNQPGVQHTQARYEMRLASVLPGQDGGAEWLTKARESSERAVSLDPEWPGFYATRANIRWRLGDLSGARLDYETALDLIAREDSAPVEWKVDWESSLERLETAQGGDSATSPTAS